MITKKLSQYDMIRYTHHSIMFEQTKLFAETSLMHSHYLINLCAICDLGASEAMKW